MNDDLPDDEPNEDPISIEYIQFMSATAGTSEFVGESGIIIPAPVVIVTFARGDGFENGAMDHNESIKMVRSVLAAMNEQGCPFGKAAFAAIEQILQEESQHANDETVDEHDQQGEAEADETTNDRSDLSYLAGDRHFDGEESQHQ